jgi:hypothetical protein
MLCRLLIFKTNILPILTMSGLLVLFGTRKFLSLKGVFDGHWSAMGVSRVGVIGVVRIANQSNNQEEKRKG